MGLDHTDQQSICREASVLITHVVDGVDHSVRGSGSSAHAPQSGEIQEEARRACKIAKTKGNKMVLAVAKNSRSTYRTFVSIFNLCALVELSRNVRWAKAKKIK